MDSDMGRWTQHEEDATRLPPGMKRIGYDADRAQYTFCDADGSIWVGAPHEEYGTLTMVKRGNGKGGATAAVERERPGVFAGASATAKHGPGLEVVIPHGNDDGATFHDFLAPHQIASPFSADSRLSSNSNSNPNSATGSRFRNAVRLTTVPAMQNVVNGLRRSVTSAKRPSERGKADSEGYGLLRGDSISVASVAEKTTASEKKN
ncbi:hypothetical protein MKEN_00263000 [Mycena kentingensis (nom. inval.)]|nr:hypothetical protein MKEN_00263000 [Mycena kentingensis (nom. inval.)]